MALICRNNTKNFFDFYQFNPVGPPERVPPKHEQNSAFCLCLNDSLLTNSPQSTYWTTLEQEFKCKLIRSACEQQTTFFFFFRIVISIKTTCCAGRYHPTTTKIIWSMWCLDIQTGVSLRINRIPHMATFLEWRVCVSWRPWLILNLFSSLTAVLRNTSQENKTGRLKSPSSHAGVLCSCRHSRLGRFPSSDVLQLNSPQRTLHQPPLIQGWQPTNPDSEEHVTGTWSYFNWASNQLHRSPNCVFRDIVEFNLIGLEQ